MRTRISGVLERVDGTEATIALAGGDLAYQVLLPAYLAQALAARTGERVTLATLEYLESPNQGATFLPRVLGFASPSDRKFFELLTTVKGIGYRKALRALALEPAAFAAAIAARDIRALTRLPEIGKRLAETIILDLADKADAFLTPGERAGLDHAARGGTPCGNDPLATDAIDALMALGEPRHEAESLVQRAIERTRSDGVEVRTVEGLLDVVFAARAR